MIKTPEQLDDLIKAVKTGRVQAARKNGAPDEAYLASALLNLPKSALPEADLLRVRSKVLDRISLPQIRAGSSAGLMAYLPRILRIAGSVIGSFAILLGATVAATAAALQSVPGQPIYPLKQIVENVQLQLADGELKKTELQIKFTNNRLDELQTIMQKKKEGKISDQEAQKIVAETVKDLEETAQAVASQSQAEPKVDLLTQIVTLSNKQTEVLQAAQAGSEGEIKLELEKALQTAAVTKEQAIKNIERVGLIVEDSPMVIEEPEDDTVSAEGKLTAVNQSALSIGTMQFLVTSETKYANITLVDLQIGAYVKISGRLGEDGKTYATQIELLSLPEPAETQPEAEPAENPEEPDTASPEAQIPQDPDPETLIIQD